MKYRLIKSGNGYHVGLKSGEKLRNGKKYLSDRPMARDEAKRKLLEKDLEEQGRKIQSKPSKKKKIEDGFMRIDPKKTKKKCPKGYEECHCKLKKILFKGNGKLCEKIKIK